MLKTKGLSEGNYVNSIDCLCALLLLLAKGAKGVAYNVVNEETHRTIQEVAQLALEVLGRGSGRVVFDIDEGNTAGYAPDVHLKLSSKRLRDLGWKPKESLSSCFLQLASYYAEQGLA